MFLSPSFLYRVEDRADLTAGASRTLQDWELAARLAALAWRSLPDQALRDCAELGLLHTDTPADDPCSVPSQITRILADPKTERALVEDFGDQWLGLSALIGLYRDPDLYPDLPADVGARLRSGSLSLLDSAVADETPLSELAAGLGAFHVDPALVGRLGLSAPDDSAPPADATSDGPVVVPAPATHPAGLLGDPGILALTGHGDRSSPVRRGQWVLAKLLCDQPDPPPPDVPDLEASEGHEGGVRGQLAAHLTNPACTSCHLKMDPIGLSLEHFDAIGAWRDRWDDGNPVDAVTALPDGTPLDGARGLADWLASEPAVDTCIAAHLAVWSLRQPVDPDADACMIEGVRSAASTPGLRGQLEGMLRHPWALTVVGGEAP